MHKMKVLNWPLIDCKVLQLQAVHLKLMRKLSCIVSYHKNIFQTLVYISTLNVKYACGQSMTQRHKIPSLANELSAKQLQWAL